MTKPKKPKYQKRYVDPHLNRLCDLVANTISPPTTRLAVQRYLKAMYVVFMNEIINKGRIHINNFGTFELVKRESNIRKFGTPHDKDGKNSKYVYVRPKYTIKFTMAKNLDKCINEREFNIRVNAKETQKKDVDMKETLADIMNKADDMKGRFK